MVDVERGDLQLCPVPGLQGRQDLLDDLAAVPAGGHVQQDRAHHRLLVILFSAAAVVFAVYTMNRIRLEAIPDLSDTQVIIYSR